MNAVIKAHRVNLKKFLKKKRIIATPKNVDFSKNATSKTKKNLIKILKINKIYFNAFTSSARFICYFFFAFNCLSDSVLVFLLVIAW